MNGGDIPIKRWNIVTNCKFRLIYNSWFIGSDNVLLKCMLIKKERISVRTTAFLLLFITFWVMKNKIAKKPTKKTKKKNTHTHTKERNIYCFRLRHLNIIMVLLIV
jgi:hypothetical protein